jgi:glycosyltransferase involved in cell wall biosynthesis
MRITVVIGPFFPMPPAPTGAIEKVWHRLCEQFAARGHEVTVIAPNAGGEPGEERRAGVRYLRTRRWQRTGSTRLDLVKDLMYAIAVLRRAPAADITVTNSFWLPALVRLVGRRKLGVINVHAQRFPKGQFGLYRGADRISTVSEAIASAIREQTPAVASVVRIIPNPVDVAVFRPDGERIARPGERVILFTGRIHPEKGLDLLVRAYASLARERRDLRLRLVGPSEIPRGGGGPEFVASLRAIAERAGAPAIEFGANIADPRELATALRSCAAYCYPSVAFFGEASPVAPLEAIACGAVTVVSDLPQFAGYLRDGETGLTFPREAPNAAEELAQQLARVLDDEALAARLRAAGIARAAELSVERVAEMHLADFEETIRARSSSRSRPPAPAAG